MSKCEMTNMVMVYDPKNNSAVVEKRVKYWCGISFPGGHIEPDESFYDSAVREVREETGLIIKNLKLCGIVHWHNNQNGDRYLVYCYKTSEYEGNLIDETDEGRVFWQSLDEISQMQLAPNFDQYLKLFTRDEFSEIFCSWNENDKSYDLQFK